MAGNAASNTNTYVQPAPSSAVTYTNAGNVGYLYKRSSMHGLSGVPLICLSF